MRNVANSHSVPATVMGDGKGNLLNYVLYASLAIVEKVQ